ncbi:hypothetical protein D3C74_250780 [compost metagenome]
MRIERNLLQQAYKMPIQTLNTCLIKAERVIHKTNLDAFTWHNDDVQIIVGFLCRHHVRNRKFILSITAQLLYLLLHRIIFKYHNMID